VSIYCRFPTDIKRRERWIVRLRRQENETGQLWKPGTRAVVCSVHFHPSDFVWQWGRKLVKPDAEPTVFTFAPPVSRRKSPQRRCITSVKDHCCHRPNLSSSPGNDTDVTNAASTSAASIDAVSLDHSYCAGTPRKLTSRVKMLLQNLQQKTSALRNMRKREMRLKGKVSDLIKRLKNMQLLSSKAEELLETYEHIPLHLLTGKVGQKFTDEQKRFAITLHYYSPAAYKFIRRRFSLMPSSRTIRSWLSRYDGSPGLTQQAFDTIAHENASNELDSAAYRLCALHIDEMEIKKHVDYDRTTGKMYGFTDTGAGMTLAICYRPQYCWGLGSDFHNCKDVWV